jgi:hypothetical protein
MVCFRYIRINTSHKEDDNDDDDDDNNNNTYFNIKDSAICTINSTRRIAATLCTLETWFVSGI